MTDKSEMTKQVVQPERLTNPVSTKLTPSEYEHMTATCYSMHLASGETVTMSALLRVALLDWMNRWDAAE